MNGVIRILFVAWFNAPRNKGGTKAWIKGECLHIMGSPRVFPGDSKWIVHPVFGGRRPPLNRITLHHPQKVTKNCQVPIFWKLSLCMSRGISCLDPCMPSWAVETVETAFLWTMKPGWMVGYFNPRRWGCSQNPAELSGEIVITKF